MLAALLRQGALCSSIARLYNVINREMEEAPPGTVLLRDNVKRHGAGRKGARWDVASVLLRLRALGAGGGKCSDGRSGREERGGRGGVGECRGEAGVDGGGGQRRDEDKSLSDVVQTVNRFEEAVTLHRTAARIARQVM